jgi:hypothetical protein
MLYKIILNEIKCYILITLMYMSDLKEISNNAVSRVGYEPTSILITLGSRVFGEKKLWLLDNRSYTKSVSAGYYCIFLGTNVPMTICILISYVLTSFKEMLWSIKFINGARPGLKRPAQVYKSSSVPSFREKYSSRENKHFKSLPVN